MDKVSRVLEKALTSKWFADPRVVRKVKVAFLVVLGLLFAGNAILLIVVAMRGTPS